MQTPCRPLRTFHSNYTRVHQNCSITPYAERGRKGVAGFTIRQHTRSEPHWTRTTHPRERLVHRSTASGAAFPWNHPNSLTALETCWASATRNLGIHDQSSENEVLQGTYRHGGDSFHIIHRGNSNLVDGVLLAHGVVDDCRLTRQLQRVVA
jgi:hypothetical protein